MVVIFSKKNKNGAKSEVKSGYYGFVMGEEKFATISYKEAHLVKVDHDHDHDPFFSAWTPPIQSPSRPFVIC